MDIFKKIVIIKQIIALLLQQLALVKAKDYDAFAEALGKRESGGDYKAVNSLGYMGKWQFGMARMCDLGYTDRRPGTTDFTNESFEWKQGYSQEYFLNTPDLQERIFKQHVQDLVERIQRTFFASLGQKVGNITFTLSGGVAGTHLGGIGGVRRFINGDNAPEDAFGTSVAEYVEKFAGYDLSKVG